MQDFLNCDCMEYMKTVPDKFFELAIVDPPYGINADIKQNKAGEKWGFKKYKNTNWDNARPSRTYFEELFRISKNQIIFGANYFTDFLPPSSCWIVWDKIQRLSFSDCEFAFTSFNKASKIFCYSRGENQGFLNKTRSHPTEKPIELYLWLLKNYAKPGDKIFDSHVGSASSLIACEELQFEYVGCELDKDYYDQASKRLANFKSQKLLF